jgi:hypothetical protein
MENRIVDIVEIHYRKSDELNKGHPRAPEGIHFLKKDILAKVFSLKVAQRPAYN